MALCMVMWRNSHSQLAMILIMAKSNATNEHLRIAIVAEHSKRFIKGNSRHDNGTLDQSLLLGICIIIAKIHKDPAGTKMLIGYAAWLASPRAFRDIVTGVQLHVML